MGIGKLNIQEGEFILEIGFGTGHSIESMAHLVGGSGKVFGVDISEKMTAITQTIIKNAGLSERVELKCGDAAQLPYENNSMDAIFCSFTLELFDTPEIAVVLNECSRVLRNQGRICVISMSKKERSNVMVRLYEWAHDRFEKFVDCRPIYAKESLEEAGFCIDSLSELSMYGLPVDIVLAKKISQ